MTLLRTLTLTLSLALVASCSSAVRYALLGTRAYPTTEGEATLEPRDGGGYDLAIEVDHLPSPERLGAGLNAYVVWITPQGTETPVRSAVLTVDPITRTGRGHATTTHTSFQLRVTAEPDADVDSPSDTAVVDAMLQAAD